jgi:hypothetical protein
LLLKLAFPHLAVKLGAYIASMFTGYQRMKRIPETRVANMTADGAATAEKFVAVKTMASRQNLWHRFRSVGGWPGPPSKAIRTVTQSSKSRFQFKISVARALFPSSISLYCSIYVKKCFLGLRQTALLSAEGKK